MSRQGSVALTRARSGADSEADMVAGRWASRRVCVCAAWLRMRVRQGKEPTRVLDGLDGRMDCC